MPNKNSSGVPASEVPQCIGPQKRRVMYINMCSIAKNLFFDDFFQWQAIRSSFSNDWKWNTSNILRDHLYGTWTFYYHLLF